MIKEKSAAYYKKRVFEFINRNISDFYLGMTVYDESLITWILERTLSYGKFAEFISLNDFMKGVYSKRNGELYRVHTPVKMSKSQLLRTIKKLEDDGILIVVRTGEKNSYGINLQHECFKELDGFISSNACMIKVGKKPKAENGSLIKKSKKSDDNVYTQDELEGEDLLLIDKIEDDINPIEIKGSSCGELGVVPVGNHSYIYNKPNKENQTKIDSSASRDSDDTSSTKKGIEEIMEEVKRKTDKAIEKKKEKVLSPKTLSVARVLDMWKLSLSKTEYTAKTDMVITKAEMGRIKVGLLPTLVLYFIETHGTGIMPEFFDWVTGNS